jgi:hypothetical protein
MTVIWSTVLLLVFAIPIAAQESNFRIVGGASVCGSCGVRSPVLSAGFGGDLKLSEAVTLDLNAAVNRRRKIPGEGYSVSGDTSLRIGREWFGIGGISVTKQTTSFYEKTAVNVFGGVGYRKDNFVLSGVYFAPDFTSPNKAQGARVKVEFFLKHKIYLAPHVEMFNFRCNQGPVGLTDRCTSSGMGINAGVYFK